MHMYELVPDLFDQHTKSGRTPAYVCVVCQRTDTTGYLMTAKGCTRCVANVRIRD